MIEVSVMVAVVMGLSEVVKRLELLKSKFVPLLNLIFGVIICVFYYEIPLKEAIFQGIVVGLTASGLFSSSRSILK